MSREQGALELEQGAEENVYGSREQRKLIREQANQLHMILEGAGRQQKPI